MCMNKNSSLVTAMTNQPEQVHLRYDIQYLKDIGEAVRHGKIKVHMPISQTLRIWKLKLARKVKRPRFKRITSNKSYVERGNLVTISMEKDEERDKRLRDKNFGLSTINIRSIKNKDNILITYLVDNKIDICVVTETWLTQEECEEWCNTSAICQHGYRISAVSRKQQRGGGVALIHKNSIQSKLIHEEMGDIIESGFWEVKVGNSQI